jgi:hypothetical protein
MTAMNRRFPALAACLSLIAPGAGQLYNGERAKGMAMLVMTAGIWFWMIMAAIGPAAFRSRFTLILFGLVYVSIWMPAVTDAYRQVPGTVQSLLSGHKRWYVIVMVLVTGIVAVPFVWQSPRLSRTAKIVWSVIGTLNTVLGLCAIAVIGPAIERLLDQYHEQYMDLLSVPP